MSKPYSFRIQVDVEEKSGRTLAVFFRVREGRSAEAREFADGAAFAHYNNRGALLGIEILSPCEITVIDRIAPREPMVKKFFRDKMPREMAIAG